MRHAALAGNTRAFSGSYPWSIDVTGLEPISNPEWHDRGICKDSETPDDWFSLDGTPEAARAKAGCLQCPVRDLCVEAAKLRSEEFGIWGGVQFEFEEFPNCGHRMTTDNVRVNRTAGREYKRCKTCEAIYKRPSRRAA
jgi:hypothetical protein